MTPLPVLIVFSHLRWGFVYQRPQHLLSRMARRWRVVFVEEPVRTEGPPRLEARFQDPGLTVLVPHTPLDQPGFHDDQMALIAPLLSAYFVGERIAEAVVWMYTPMALPLLATVPARAVVYDCMDELAAFKGAPEKLRERERALFARADVVFTGGPSLYEAKRHLHPNVHCIPSSVDARHFAPAGLVADGELARRAQELQGQLTRPRIGFFGVIDERLDLGLVGALADAHPEWQVVMVGPVVKIDPASVPQRANLHWLGMQSYDLLPYLLAGWDLCLMPFALNESTRFISPTKTLEYMAAGCAVVSTPVHDVVELYGRGVQVADTDPASFVRACETVLQETLPARRRRAQAMEAIVSGQSWDDSARRVEALIDATLADDRAAKHVRVERRAVPRAAAGLRA